jgi:hypothetical protein
MTTFVYCWLLNIYFNECYIYDEHDIWSIAFKLTNYFGVYFWKFLIE